MGSYTRWRSSFYDKIKSDLLNDAANNAGPMGGNADTSEKKFELAASLGFLWVDRNVETVIGSSAILESGGDITIGAHAVETGNVIIEAGASEAEDSKLKDNIGASIAVSIYESTVRAVINDGATVDAFGEIEVDAGNIRRFPVEVDSPEEFFNDLVDDFAANPLVTLGELNKSLLHPLFTTGWVYTRAASKNTDVAVAFTLQISVDNNHTEAIIADGAQINQKPAFRSEEQAVSVNAETEFELVNMAGVFDFGLNAENLVFGPLLDLRNKDKKAKLQKRASKLVEFGAEAEKDAYGTSFQWIDISNHTVAAIGGSSPVGNDGETSSKLTPSGEPARVHSGPSGGVSVTAKDDLLHIGFVDSGAKTEDGEFAFAGSGQVFRYNPRDGGGTTAMIGSGTEITGGSVEVMAADDVKLISQNGDFITGDSTGSVGIGVTYIELNRRVRAYIGDENGESMAATKIDLDDDAEVTVEAESEGFVVSLALAGSVRTDPPPAENEDGQVEAPEEAQEDNGNGANAGKSGWALAGDATVIDLVADQVLAFIDDTGEITADAVTVTATNSNDYVNLAGAFSVVKEGDDSNSNTGLAGSFAGIELHRHDDGDRFYTSDTLAFIRRATLDVGAGGLHMTADRRGTYWVTAAGGSGVSQGEGVEVAGSAAWTDLDYATRAYLEQADVTLAGDSTITSRDRVATIAFAGDGVFKGSLGFGTSWAWNHVDRRVHATINDSTITQSAGTLDVNSVIWDIDKDNGRTLLPSAYAVAATLGIGDQNETAAELTGTVAVNEFNTATSDAAVESSMTASTYTNPDGPIDVTGLSLTATDNTNLLAFAGAVDGDATVTLGVAVAQNRLADTATAYIERSTVHVSEGDVDVTAVINPEMNAFALGLGLKDSGGGALAGSGASNVAP